MAPPVKQESNIISDNGIAVLVEEQPSVEVRTRTPSENRTFSVRVRATGPYWTENFVSVRVSLVYASPDPDGVVPVCIFLLYSFSLLPF